jgi:uncharacterized metal-binding protein
VIVKTENYPECAKCTVSKGKRACMTPGGAGSKACPTLIGKAERERAQELYRQTEIAEFARQATIQEGECYSGREKRPQVMHPVKPRMQEILEFAEKMGYSRLGLAFCAGLSGEAATVDQILTNHGFETVSVACKAGAVPKEEINVRDDQKIRIGAHESMCNPILQAMLLNDAGTHFNILLGLCVGHDSLFFKYAEAPVTVLAVKDRVTGHNPLACIYTAGTFYSWLKNP